MPQFRIHRAVEFEFREVRTWYAGHSPWAAENFIHAFHAALEKVRLRPTAHAPWCRVFRRVRLARFPYLVIFHADDQTTSVLALVHKRQEPKHKLAVMSRRRGEFS
jgi:plasmid stabilization system protein ParE